jgi:hypothetical protein
MGGGGLREFGGRGEVPKFLSSEVRGLLEGGEPSSSGTYQTGFAVWCVLHTNRVVGRTSDSSGYERWFISTRLVGTTQLPRALSIWHVPDRLCGLVRASNQSHGGAIEHSVRANGLVRIDASGRKHAVAQSGNDVPERDRLCGLVRASHQARGGAIEHSVRANGLVRIDASGGKHARAQSGSYVPNRQAARTCHFEPGSHQQRRGLLEQALDR